ncbi:hypothetical protein [Curtobacterium sp. RRHDQ10]|uniref:hypothetical protein n=1 Tax=Curtobacterium phyllosphaerae TaxID=3413379 RepID=UPI003BF15A04
MTTTPLFDAIARRSDRSVVPPIVPSGYRPAPKALDAPARPSRPALLAAAVQTAAAPRSLALSAALVAEIDAIPAVVRCPDARAFDAGEADSARFAGAPGSAGAASTQAVAQPPAPGSVSTSTEPLMLSSADRVVVAAAGDAVIRRVVRCIDAELLGVHRRRAVVDALGDRLTQLVVDTIADELDRIDDARAIRRS